MYTVVVADDESELRRALIRKVDWESAGFSVVGDAENGAEALELVEKLEPDLLLTDIRMPFLSGIELARQVREVRPSTQIVFLSGYDDFAYAQQAIQYNIISYLLKPISSAEMMEELKKIKTKIDKKFEEFVSADYHQGRDLVEISEFLMPVILDGFQRPSDDHQNEQLKREAVRCGLLKDVHDPSLYTVMVTSIMDDEKNNRTTRMAVNAIDMILRKYIRHTSFYSEGKVISLLLASEARFDKYLHIIVEDIAQSVKRIMGLSTLIGVSRPVKKFSEIHNAYQETMYTLGYTGKSENGVCFITDMKRTEVSDVEMLENFVNELVNLIKNGSLQEVESYMEQIFERLKSKQASSLELNYLVNKITFSVYQIIYAISEAEVIREIQECAPIRLQTGNVSVLEVKESCIHFCLNAKKRIAEQRKKSSEVICERALKLIEEQYGEPDISLASVSSQISVSPNYLSALLKKETGSTFVDILTQRRMETAKTLLQHSGMKIREISDRCGYRDQHYFSYCFKKSTGISPVNYRRDYETARTGEQ